MAKTNTIPGDLILLDNKLLWCKNAKAGSSSMYFSVLPFIFGNGVGCQWHKKCRCYGHNNCWYDFPFPEDAAPNNVNNETRKKAHNKDEEMREFYLEAATQKNVSMEALVEKVGKIYHLDVGLGRYTFPW